MDIMSPIISNLIENSKSKKNKKILMFGWEFPPQNSGGLGVACEGISKWLSILGTDIYFVLPKQGEIKNSHCNFIFADVNKGIKKIGIDSPLYPYITSETYNTLGSYENKEEQKYGRDLLGEVLRYGDRASEIASTLEFDIIHAHDWLSFPAGIKAKEATGKPLVAHVHATEFDRVGGNGVNENVYKIEKEGMEKADIVITVSNYIKNLVIEKYGINPAKIEVVHNGFETPKEFQEIKNPEEILKLKKQGSKVVLFLGRITIQKGPDYFIQSAKMVLDYGTDAYFVVTGSGDMETQIIEQAAELGISDRVLFTGFFRGENLWKILEAADLYIMPSVSEPFGLTPLEAISKDTPVLISKQSGVSEILNHAIKADFWDVNKIAERIISIFENSELSDSLTENSKEELKNITWEKTAKKCKEIYKKLN